MKSIIVSILVFCMSIVVVYKSYAAESELVSLSLVAAAKNITVDGNEYVLKEKSDANRKTKQVAKQQEPTVTEERSSGFLQSSGKVDNFTMQGKYGLGLEASVLNMGLGLSAEYWITDNIVASGHFSGLGDFTTYGIRADYMFSKPLTLYQGLSAEPYAGLGYTWIKGPEESSGIVKIKTEGSGVDFHVGLFMPASYIYPKVALRCEVGYSTAKVEATGSESVSGTSAKVSADYSSFGMGFGIYYFFN